MNFGYVFLLLALTAFGALGIFHKIADHPECRPKMTALLLFFWDACFPPSTQPHWTRRVCISRPRGFNCGITMALKTVKGSIAYPVNNGSLLIVVIAGILFFKEKIHPVGFAGIVFGISAVLVLVLN